MVKKKIYIIKLIWRLYLKEEENICILILIKTKIKWETKKIK